MKIIQTVFEAQNYLESVRTLRKIALVPTMGNLHEGHLKLIDRAREENNFVVVSIFVNPTQFGANEDFDKYPRTLEADIEKLKSRNVDLLFAPNNAEIYQNDSDTQVYVNALSQELCGKFRPTHFAGVTTVVMKLFNIIRPHIAVFGEKDFQQVCVIKQMVRDLFVPVEIMTVATVREIDGLAMSSRNQYLDPEEREIAKEFFVALMNAREKLSQNFSCREIILQETENFLQQHNFKIDYISLRERESLKSVTENTKELVLLGAVHLGKTRLIDNILIDLV